MHCVLILLIAFFLLLQCLYDRKETILVRVENTNSPHNDIVLHINMWPVAAASSRGVEAPGDAALVLQYSDRSEMAKTSVDLGDCYCGIEYMVCVFSVSLFLF